MWIINMQIENLFSFTLMVNLLYTDWLTTPPGPLTDDDEKDCPKNWQFTAHTNMATFKFNY